MVETARKPMLEPRYGASEPGSEAWSELKSLLPSGRLTRDPEELAAVAGDESSAAPCKPLALVEAGGLPDIQACLTWSQRYGVPVTPRGAGSGKAGGCVPEENGLVLSLAAMGGIDAVCPEHGYAEVQPGVITGPFRDLMEEEHRLFYPPDPNSLDWCTLGGNVATNAGGPVALKYGVTGAYVLGITAVLPDGRVLETGKRQPKGVAGYDLSSLLVGSEGTLAVIAGIRLGLLPRPIEVLTGLVAFHSLRAAAEAVVLARTSGLNPRALELVDGVTLNRVRPHADFRVEANWGALLLVEFDGPIGQPEAAFTRFVDLIPSPGALMARLARDPVERAQLWEMRRKMSALVKKGTVGYLSEDVAVPTGSIPTLVERLAPVAERHGLIVATYGHAGDGNLHVNLLWEEPSAAARVEAAAEDVIRIALELGGTISGEHGVGLLKRRFLPWELGETALSLQRSLKAQWDPKGLLNPGKVFASRLDFPNQR